MDWSQGPLASLFGSPDSRSPGSYAARGARLGMAGGPLGAGLGALGGWLYGRFNGTQTGPIAGQGTLDTMLGNDIAATQGQIWGNPDTPSANDPSATDMGPSAYALDPNATSMGPPGSLAGGDGGGGTLGQISDEGGDYGAPSGIGDGWNDASSAMLADFAAPQGGDWMARLQSKVGKEGTYATAKEE